MLLIEIITILLNTLFFGKFFKFFLWGFFETPYFRSLSVSNGHERLGWCVLFCFFGRAFDLFPRTVYDILPLFTADSVITVILMMQSIILPLCSLSC